MATQTLTADAVISNKGKTLTLTRGLSMTRMHAMASKMWAPWLAMGFMVVVASLVVGFINSSITADYFAAAKIDREAALAGSSLVGNKVFIETTKIWLPAFKFLGMGMLLGGITFALATILGNLRVGGGKVQQAIGKGIVVMEPPPHRQAVPHGDDDGGDDPDAGPGPQYLDGRGGRRLLGQLHRHGVEPRSRGLRYTP